MAHGGMHGVYAPSLIGRLFLCGWVGGTMMGMRYDMIADSLFSQQFIIHCSGKSVTQADPRGACDTNRSHKELDV